MHNVGQIIAGIVIMQSVNVIAYLPLLLIAAIPMGFLAGGITILPPYPMPENRRMT